VQGVVGQDGIGDPQGVFEADDGTKRAVDVCRVGRTGRAIT